jgi:hypothetical protein
MPAARNKMRALGKTMNEGRFNLTAKGRSQGGYKLLGFSPVRPAYKQRPSTFHTATLFETLFTVGNIYLSLYQRSISKWAALHPLCLGDLMAYFY